MNSILRDLKLSMRALRRAPGFSLVVVITLALGIGANTAIFSVVHAVLLQPFPFHQPDRVMVVWENNLAHGLPFMYASPPNYADWHEQNRAFTEMAAFDVGPQFLQHEGEPRRVQTAEVTTSLAEVLGVSPQLGRWFTEEEQQPGNHHVLLLSHDLWQARFDADPSVLGTTVELDETIHTIIGVMPPAFTFPPPIDLEGSNPYARTEVWVPLGVDLAGSSRGAHYLTVLARLQPGMERQQAENEMVQLAARLEAEHPDANEGWSATVVPVDEQVLGDFRPALMMLLGAVGAVLLIACVNVANLLLARGAGRQKECAVRAALGAGRGRLVRQLLTESLVLALAGGITGLLLAAWGIDLLRGMAPTNVPRLDEASLNLPVLGFTLLISLGTGLLFGLLPAFQASSPDLQRWLKQDGRGSGAAAGGRWLRPALVVAEVALSLILLVGAGLLARSFLELKGVDPGFRTDDVLTLRVALPKERYPERAQWPARFRLLESEMAALPGVQAAGFVHDIPLAADRQGTSFTVVGDPPPETSENRQINFSFITPGYFDAMGIRVLHGRAFNDQDFLDAPDVVVINQALVDRFFGQRDPMGLELVVGFSSKPRRVVGVVGNVRHDKLQQDAGPAAYVPYYQVPWGRALSLSVRSNVDPSEIRSSVLGRMASLEPDAPVYDVMTMSQVVRGSMAQPRFSTLLVAVFASVAAVLAAVGIYGVISFSVNQGTRDIGIRMALGAQAGDIFRLVVGRGMALALIGMVIGLAGAAGLTRFVESMLFGVSPTDLATFGGISALLGGVAFVACYVPARRATRVDPNRVLHQE
jgi:putative ABC transport system permease protein